MASKKNKQQVDERILKLELLQHLVFLAIIFSHAFGSTVTRKNPGKKERKGIQDAVNFFLDPHLNLVYLAGKYVVLKKLDDNIMKHLKDNSQQITCLAFDSEKNKIAIAQQGRNGKPFVSFVTFNQKKSKEIKNSKHQVYEADDKIFTFQEAKSDTIISMAFSSKNDARFLICLAGGQSNCQLVFLDIQRMQAQGTKTLDSTSYNKVSINPQYEHRILVSGDERLAYYRVSENSFKPFQDIKDINTTQNFTDHVWFDQDILIVSNDQGTLSIIKQEKLVQTIPNAFKIPGEKRKQNEDLYGVSALCVCGNPPKWVVAGSPHGQMAIWFKTTKVDDVKSSVEKLFFPIRIWTLDRKSSIISISCSTTSQTQGDGYYIAVAFSSNDIATFQMQKALEVEDDEEEEEGKQKLTFKKKKFRITDIYEDEHDPAEIKRKVALEYVYDGFHNGAINSMDICKHRPFIVTSSTDDSTIRIWNYANYKCELARKFYVGTSEDSSGNIKPLRCVALHPNGFYMAVAFINKLRFYHILEVQLKLYREIILKNINIIRFCDGGQWIAAGHPKKNLEKSEKKIFEVTVFNSYTQEQIVVFSDFVNPIVDMIWTQRDKKFYISTQKGLIRLYKFIPKEFTCVQKINELNKDVEQEYFTLQASHVQNDESVYSVGVYNNSPVIAEIKGSIFNQKNNQKVVSQKLSTICVANKLNIQSLVGGTIKGDLIVYPAEFNPKGFTKYNAHLDHVTTIICSADGRYLFSCSNDGIVFVFGITEYYGKGKTRSSFPMPGDQSQNNQRTMVVEDGLADTVLIQRIRFEQKMQELRELRKKVQELEKQLEIQQNEDKNKLKREKAKAQAQKNVEIAAAEQRFKDLKKEKQQKEEELLQQLKTRDENHLKAVLELEALYEKKLAFENEKYMTIEQELEEQRIEHKTQMENLLNKHKETIDKLNKEFSSSFKKSEGKYKETKATAEQLKQDYEKKLDLMEDAHETEIQDLQEKHTKEKEKLEKQRDEHLHKKEKLNNEMHEWVNKVSHLEKTLAQDQKEIQQLAKYVKENDKKIEQRQEEIKKHARTLEKQSQKIHEYKFKMNDLQKTKHVLSFRTTEMRKSLEPKEAQIEKLKNELTKLEEEFEKMLKTSQDQNDILFKQEKKIEILNASLNKQKGITKAKETTLISMIMDIDNCVNMKVKKQKRQQSKLKLQVKAMVRIYQDYKDYYNYNPDKKRVPNHDKSGVADMVRRISHLETSLYQMNDYTSKIVERRQKDIQKKTQENSDLLMDLNGLKQENQVLDIKHQRLLLTKDVIKKRIKAQKQKYAQIKQRIQILASQRHSVSKSQISEYQEKQQQGYQGQGGMGRSRIQQRLQESQIQARIFELNVKSIIVSFLIFQDGLVQVRQENQKIIFAIQEMRERFRKFLDDKQLLDEFDFDGWDKQDDGNYQEVFSRSQQSLSNKEFFQKSPKQVIQRSIPSKRRMKQQMAKQQRQIKDQGGLPSLTGTKLT